MNLVVVSNRVARAKSNEPMTGGLAAALLPVIEQSGGIWVGSSGKILDNTNRNAFAHIEPVGAGALALLDLPAAHYGGYYEGFANSALWPAMHSRVDLIRTSQEDYNSYREVNAFMARALLRFCTDETVLWVQDYHFLALGAELRELGIRQPIGFFLHTPWPAPGVVRGVPNHRELVQRMLAYDLIGFQTQTDCANFTNYLRAELGLVVKNGRVTSPYGVSRLAAFPIGIDVDAFATQAAKAVLRPEVSRLRKSLDGRKLAIGVDRLDYSKGLINRISAFDRMLTQHPELSRAVSFLQIATPSRGTIEAYGSLQDALAKLVSDVNGRHGEVDWVPIRYLNRGFSQVVLSGFYRTAQVGIVTPFYDGMNLVAKEYVAAQNPEDPGVLILSKFAGAAIELDAALLINPHDTDQMARTMAVALNLPLAERRMRYEAMMQKLRANTIHHWVASFMTALGETRMSNLLLETTSPPIPRPIGRPRDSASLH